MTREHFSNLLNDLYDIYNPGKKEVIPELLNKYNGSEFDAIYNFFFTYNYPRSNHYNPKLGTQEHIKKLIEEYSQEKRTAGDIKKYSEEKSQDAHKEVVESIKNEIVDEKKKIETSIDDRMKSIDDFFKEKEKALNNLFLTLSKEHEPGMKIETKLEVLYTETDLQIPKEVEKMSIGSRFMVYDKDKRPHGMEIIDIMWDFISYEDKCIRNITIEKR